MERRMKEITEGREERMNKGLKEGTAERRKG